MQIKRDQLQALIEVAPYIGDIINEDVSVAIMDSTKFIITTDGRTIISSSRSGDRNTYDNAALSVLKAQKTVSFEDRSGHFDFPVEVTFTPVMENNGTPTDVLVAVVKNIQKQDKLENASKAISNSFEQANKAISEIAADSQNLSVNIHDIIKYTNETQEKLIEIDSLIRGIKTIALKSNILAINAGIEAVHAGNAGRGFSVIAKEMGNLSKSSDEAAETVNKSLTEIKNAIETITAKIDLIGTYSGNQAVSTQEISATVNEIYKTFKDLTG
jgi:prefoldin subunit 5